jgi:hypothetical protein
MNAMMDAVTATPPDVDQKADPWWASESNAEHCPVSPLSRWRASQSSHACPPASVHVWLLERPVPCPSGVQRSGGRVIGAQSHEGPHHQIRAHDSRALNCGQSSCFARRTVPSAVPESPEVCAAPISEISAVATVAGTGWRPGIRRPIVRSARDRAGPQERVIGRAPLLGRRPSLALLSPAPGRASQYPCGAQPGHLARARRQNGGSCSSNSPWLHGTYE